MPRTRREILDEIESQKAAYGSVRALTPGELRAGRPDRHSFGDLPRHPVAFVLDNLTNGFNVGSAFRLADALRLHSVHPCGTAPAPPQARITKTSMGTEHCPP